MKASADHQTRAFLMQRFEEIGARPKTKYGQNFLIDLNLQDLLLRSARLTKEDVVLEVGTGTGALTVPMARQAAAVVTVEVDSQLVQLAEEDLVEFDNVELLQVDALKNKNTINPVVLDAVRARMDEAPDRRFKLVANLPYNIATPIISNLLLCDVVPRSMTVTIQKELGDRIGARPRTKDYSALSIWIQSQCYVDTVRVMPPSVFWPRPKVWSTILHILRKDAWRDRISDLPYFHALVKALFFHRRKFLRSSILSAFKGQLTKPEVDEIMAELGFSETTRAEELDVPTVIKLGEALRRRVPTIRQ